MYNEHYEHFSRKNGALRWSILVGKQKHNVQKPNDMAPENTKKSTPLAIVLNRGTSKSTKRS